MTHNLFGGIKQTKKHKIYHVILENNYCDYRCDFRIYDEEKICNDIPKIRNGPWIKKAKKLESFFVIMICIQCYKKMLLMVNC